MKTKWILLVVSIMCTTWMLHADETITVTATSSDISEDLNLKTVATLFGQCKDLEQFELLLNHPDSAFSNLDLNGDGEVDYLRVVETADGNKHLVVIQAVLAKDIYQDVASIYVEKDERNKSVTVQVIGDEYIYGTNYIIEPVYIYTPIIYDWFWGPSWVCYHSPYYWGYYPHHWRPYYCIDPYLYWDDCYWHHYHHPICSYRHVHRPHRHYHDMHHHVRRNDYAHRHPERSFATRNASRNITNARAIEQGRRSEMVQGGSGSRTRVSGQAGTATRQNRTAAQSGTGTRSNTFGSTNVRGTSTTRTHGTTGTAVTRGTSTSTSVSRSSSTGTRSTTGTGTRSTSVSTSTGTRSTSVGTRSTGTSVRTSTTGTSVRSTGTSTRSTSTSTSTSTRSTSTRSSSVGTSTSTRSSVSGGGYSGGSRSGSGGYSGGSTRTSSGGGSRTR